MKVFVQNDFFVGPIHCVFTHCESDISLMSRFVIDFEKQIENIIFSFRKLGVNYIGPCHCSGDVARQLFKKEYGDNFINVGVGKVINMDYFK